MQILISLDEAYADTLRELAIKFQRMSRGPKREWLLTRLEELHLAFRTEGQPFLGGPNGSIRIYAESRGLPARWVPAKEKGDQ